MQIIRPGTDLINGLVTHYIHVFFIVSPIALLSEAGPLLTPAGEDVTVRSGPWTAFHKSQ